MSGQWAEAGQTIIAPHRFNVTVAKLSGEVILDKVELEGTEKVSDIINRVQKALGHAGGVDLVTTNGDKLLKDKSIEENKHEKAHLTEGARNGVNSTRGQAQHL